LAQEEGSHEATHERHFEAIIRDFFRGILLTLSRNHAQTHLPQIICQQNGDFWSLVGNELTVRLIANTN
jgi:hypothetical protein